MAIKESFICSCEIRKLVSKEYTMQIDDYSCGKVAFGSPAAIVGGRKLGWNATGVFEEKDASYDLSARWQIAVT